MLTQKELDKMAKATWLSMEDAINSMERELKKGEDEYDKALVTFQLGRVQEKFSLLHTLLNIEKL